MSTSQGFAKCLLVVFNVVFVVLGIGMLGAGMYAKFNKNNVAAKFPELETSDGNVIDIKKLISLAASALIIGGAFVALVGFFGCWGAYHEIASLLLIYSIILGILITVELAFIALAFLGRKKIKKELLEFLDESIKKNYTGKTGFKSDGEFFLSNNVMTLAWDFTQFKLQCCGVNGKNDYKGADNWDKKVQLKSGEVNAVVPLSCCKLKDEKSFPDITMGSFSNLNGCLASPTNDSAHALGCYEVVKNQLMQYARLSGVMGIAIAIMEIGGIIAALWLRKHSDGKMCQECPDCMK